MLLTIGIFVGGILVGLVAGFQLGGRAVRGMMEKQLPDFRGHKDYDRLQNVGNRIYNKLRELTDDCVEVGNTLPFRDNEYLNGKEGRVFFPIYRIWFKSNMLPDNQIGMLEYDAKTRQITVMPCSTEDHIRFSRIYFDNEADEAAQFYFDHVLSDVREQKELLC